MTQESTPGAVPPPSWTPDPAPSPTQVAAASPVAPPPPAPASFAPAPISPTVAPRKNRASMGTALLLVGALVAIGGVSFAVGRVTAPAPPAATGFGGRGTGTGGAFGGTGTGTGGGFGRGAGALSINGTVVAIDASTIQVKLASGNTVTLNLGSNVTYRNANVGTAADVTPGATVEIGLAPGGGGNGPSASGNPRPSGGFGGGFGAGFTGTVGTITVVK